MDKCTACSCASEDDFSSVSTSLDHFFVWCKGVLSLVIPWPYFFLSEKICVHSLWSFISVLLKLFSDRIFLIILVDWIITEFGRSSSELTLLSSLEWSLCPLLCLNSNSRNTSVQIMQDCFVALYNLCFTLTEQGDFFILISYPSIWSSYLIRIIHSHYDYSRPFLSSTLFVESFLIVFVLFRVGMSVLELLSFIWIRSTKLGARSVRSSCTVSLRHVFNFILWFGVWILSSPNGWLLHVRFWHLVWKSVLYSLSLSLTRFPTVSFLRLYR